MIRPYSLAVGFLVVVSLVLAPRVVGGPEEKEGARTRPVLRTGDVPLGSLGQPLGDYLTIEGVRLDAGKTGASTLRVDIVNGRKLSEPVAIWVDNLDLPKDKRCKIKGYETARMIGKPPAASDAEEEMGKDAPQPQASWQVQLYFVALRIVEPEGLRIPKEHRTSGDFQQLQGTWQATSLEDNGEKATEAVVKQMKLVFEGKSFTFFAGDTVLMQGTAKLDLDAKPKALDLVSTAGRLKGRTAECIYELDGDTLRICLGSPGGSRPTEFKSGKDQPLATYKRTKP